MLKTCFICKRLFDDYMDTNSMCPDCRSKEEALLREVKDYLWNNPGTTEAKLNEIFDVPSGQINKWLRDGRLELTPDSAIKLRCTRCGSMILSGKYCNDCADRIKDGFNKSLAPKEISSIVLKDPEEKNSKMHFIKKE
ncbi:MAG: hypothetical protein J6N21_17015 [Butyrivibrio sp.]|nr:hypothetical protein [Butyrivibrio sp.]